MLGLAIGSISVPVLVALVGPGGAVAIVGCLLLIVPVVTTPALRRIERSAPTVEHELGVVRGSPLFSMLGPPVLEDLARSLARVDAPAGKTIVREGEIGSAFFLVEAGSSR